ncbi:MAG: efflux RND transporter permease subunit, partial [Longimicrobiales bacterium]
MSIPRLSIRRPVAVAVLCIAATFLGVLSVTRLPVDLLPDIAYPKLVIYTVYPQVGPSEVERFITEPIESRVARVPGVERLESITREGVSLVILHFAWGTNMDFAALNVRERVDELLDALPETAERPVVLRTDPRSEPIVALSVAGSNSLWELKELAESVFRRRLEQLDGVAQAATTGGLEREIQVEIDPVRLESYGLTIDDLAQALDAANAASQSGTIRRGRFRYALRTLGELQSVDEIGSIVITQPVAGGDTGSSGAGGDNGQAGESDGLPGRVLLRDVAVVHDGFKDRESIARYNGQEAIGLLVFKESGANTVRVAQQVDQVLDQLRTEYPDVTVQIAMSQAGFVSSAIMNLVFQMVLGGGLAFLVLVVFLRDPRYPVAMFFAVPISVISTFALLHVAGVSVNIMSLGGLALGIGMLVDNSIVVIENVSRHREKGLKAAAAAVAGTEEVQRAITASTLTTVAVFFPIVYVEGVAGQLFGALSFAVAFSLLASLAVAVTLLPMLAAKWESEDGSEFRVPGSEFQDATRNPEPGTRNPLMRALGAFSNSAPFRAFDRLWMRFTSFYERTLAAAVEHRTRVILIALCLVALSVPFALSLDRTVLPAVEQGEFRAVITLDRGTTLETTSETAAALESILLADDAVDAVFTRVGRQAAIAGVEEEISGLHTAMLEVKLKLGGRTRDVFERLRPQLTRFPPGSISLETGHATALGQLLGAGEADLAVRVRGDDLDAALAYAASVEARLAAAPNLANVRVGTELGQPEYLVEIDRERAAAFGITTRRIAAVVENYMYGNVPTQFVDFDRKVDIIVRLPEDARRSLETLRALRVDGVPLTELVRVRESVGPVEIQRAEQSRMVPVYADVTGGGVDRAVAAVQAAIGDLPVPDGLRVDVGGENVEMRRSFRHLALAFALAVLLVYMILAAQFESFLHPFTVLLSVPLALIGAFFTLWLFGAGINTVSLIGIV